LSAPIILTISHQHAAQSRRASIAVNCDGQYPDTMPQAIKLLDADDRSCIC
jgi:hypothetical protein